MSTATVEQGRKIAAVVGRARSNVYCSRLALGTVVWCITTGAIWLTLFALDNLFRLPGGLRFPLGIVAVLATIAGLWRNVLRPLFERQSPAATALLLEQKYGIGQNVLINSLQFSALEFSERQRPFIEETIGAGTGGLSAVSLRDLWQPVRLLKWGVVLALIAGLWGGYTALAPRHASNALARYLFPLADVPPIASVELKVSPAQDIAVAEGDNLRVTVEVAGLGEGQRLASYPELFWKVGIASVDPQPAGANRIVMQPIVGKTNLYTHTFFGIRRDLAFRVFAQDAYSRSIQATVHPAPRISEAQFRLTPPAYVGAAASVSMGPPHPVSALPGSKLEIEIKLNQAAKALRWKAAGETLEFHEKNHVWRAETAVRVAGPYDIEVERAGLAQPIKIASGVISLLADRPPQIEFAQPVMSWTVLPGERVPLQIRAEDDQGVKQIALTVKSAFGGGSLATVKSWNYDGPPGKKGALEEHLDLNIDAALFTPGSRYLVEATCSDFCPENSASVSRPVLIEVKAVDKLEMPADAKLSDAYTALDRAIAQQKKALDATRILGSHADDVWLNLSGKARPKEEVEKLLTAHRTQIFGNQREVRNILLSVGAKGGDTRLVKRMRELGEKEATLANDQSYTVTLPTVSGKAAADHRPAASLERQEISFPASEARYIGIVVPAVHNWQDRLVLKNIEISDSYAMNARRDGPDTKIVAGRGTAKPEDVFGDAHTWQESGSPPYYLVIDLGKSVGVNRLAFTPGAADGMPRSVKIYLGKDAPPAVEPKEQTKETLLADLSPLERTQESIYNELVALKGQEAKKAAKEKEELAKKALGEGLETPPSVQENLKKFADELKDWTKEHKTNAEKRKEIMDKPGQDFSEEELDALSKLTMEKRQQARRLEDMVENLANSGAMDFADPSMAKTIAKLMTDAKDLKDMENLAASKAEAKEFTFNLDKAITSKAEELAKGTEDTTHVKPTPGSSEAPEDMKNLPYLQQLPTELAVTVPPLKQKLDDLYEKIKQGGMSLANTTNATEGPIAPSPFSGTSAQGKMGDATPDPKMDRSGRSNVGRTGKSDGQMVGSSAPAIPDDEVKIPERMSSTPLDSGKDVEDKSGTQATSTGLGKSTNGLTEFGTNGMLPQGLEKKMRQVLKEAQEVRSSAHDLILKLQRHGLPTADLKMALYRLEQATEAMKRGDGVAIRAAYDETMRHLAAAQKSLGAQFDLRQAQQANNAQRQRELAGGEAGADPRGYEDIIGAYFRQLAEKK